MLNNIEAVAIVWAAAAILAVAGAILAEFRANSYLIGRLIGHAVRRRALRWLGFPQDPKASSRPPETIDVPSRWLD